MITPVLDGGVSRFAPDDVDKRKQAGAPSPTTPSELALRRIVPNVLTRPSVAAGLPQ